MWRPQTANGTLFADPTRLPLWLELLDRCRMEVVQIGEVPARWLALPIDTSTEEILFRYNTMQGWRTPEDAAYAELAFAPPRQAPEDEQLSEWYWRDARCETSQSGQQPRTSKARKTSLELFSLPQRRQHQ